MTQTVLITGAARRIGRYIALAMADGGWDVVVHYHASADAAHELVEMIAEKGRKAWAVQADLTCPLATAGLIPALEVVPDCLINNAALFEKDTLATITPQGWQRHSQVNLFAPLQLIRDFADRYQGTQGNIIHITDGINGWSLSPGFLSYTISKTALQHTVSLLAPELAPAIRINAVAPGATLEGQQDKADTFARLQEKMPLKRTSSPEEIMQAIAYLLSAPSVTGQVISLAGGL